MIKVYAFDVRMMNGTVTMDSQTSIFSSKELAEKVRKAVISENSENHKLAFAGIRFEYSEVRQRIVFETEGEIPFLNRGKEEDGA